MKRLIKAVRVGSTTYVALPMDWVTTNGIAPRDTLEVSYTDSEVIVRPRRDDPRLAKVVA